MEIKEVFRGHFDECMLHFSKRLNEKVPHKKGLYEKLEPMKEFCNVLSISTVKGWLHPQNPILPNGELKIKILCYLQLHGYTVIEFDRASPSVKGAAELIGFSIFSGQLLSEKIGYAKTGSLYDVINKKTAASEEVLAKIWEIWKQNRNALEERKAFCFEHYRLGPGFLAAVNAVPETPGVNEPIQTIDTVRDTSIKPIISIIQGLLGLLSIEYIQNLSQKEVEEAFKNATTVNELSLRLGALTSKIVSAKVG